MAERRLEEALGTASQGEQPAVRALVPSRSTPCSCVRNPFSPVLSHPSPAAVGSAGAGECGCRGAHSPRSPAIRRAPVPLAGCCAAGRLPGGIAQRSGNYSSSSHCLGACPPAPPCDAHGTAGSQQPAGSAARVHQPTGRGCDGSQWWQGGWAVYAGAPGIGGGRGRGCCPSHQGGCAAAPEGMGLLQF